MALLGQRFYNEKKNKGNQQFISRGHGFVQTSRQSNAQIMKVDKKSKRWPLVDNNKREVVGMFNAKSA